MFNPGPDVTRMIYDYKTEFEKYEMYKSLTWEGCIGVITFMQCNMPLYDRVLGDIDDFMFLDILIELGTHLEFFKHQLQVIQDPDFVGLPEEMFDKCEYAMEMINDHLYTELHLLEQPFKFLYMSPLFYPPLHIWNYGNFCFNNL